MKRSIQLAGMLLLAVVVGLTWQGVQAQQDDAEVNAQAGGDTQLQIGTYDPQELFMTYHRTQAFQQNMQQLQAQVADDPAAAGQVQQQAQQMQEELIQNFQQDIDNALPEVADKKGVSLVAVQVVYQDPGIEVNDLTSDLSEKINEGQQAAQPEAPALNFGQ